MGERLWVGSDRLNPGEDWALPRMDGMSKGRPADVNVEKNGVSFVILGLGILLLTLFYLVFLWE